MLVASLQFKRGASYQLHRFIDVNLLRLHISVAWALEYEAVLMHENLTLGATKQQIDSFLNYLFTVIHLIPFVPRQRPSLCDPDDERILEVAVQCGATIVTHNQKDFKEAKRFGVAVKTPAEILEALRRAA